MAERERPTEPRYRGRDMQTLAELKHAHTATTLKCHKNRAAGDPRELGDPQAHLPSSSSGRCYGCRGRQVVPAGVLGQLLNTRRCIT